MKPVFKIFLITLFIIGGTIENVNAQDAYGKAVGIRGGTPTGVSYKHFLEFAGAIEGIFGYNFTNGRVFTLSGLYEHHFFINYNTNFFAGGSAYNASKFGLVGFTQAVMMDLRAYGIKVSTIMPGSVATHFNGHVPVPEDAWKIQPEDIGELVVDVLKMNPRTLPSKIEVRPSMPR